MHVLCKASGLTDARMSGSLCCPSARAKIIGSNNLDSDNFHLLKIITMTLIEDIEEHFGTKNLYEVLNASKDSTKDQIKKAYRKTSLKVHPDRVDAAHKDEATRKFQVLAQVHFVLSDEERRKLYDEHGIIANEDSLDSEADWANYWRLLFPKISEKDIQSFKTKYIDSKEEEDDLIAIYNRFKGDLDKISETHMFYDEDRTVEQISQLIEEGRLEKFKKFSNEPESKRDRRRKFAQREAKQAEKAKREMKDKEPDLGDLTALIQKRQQNNFDSMIANLEAKYGNKTKSSKGTKRKRGKD